MDIALIIKPVVFYVFAAIAVISALMVVILRNPLYSASTLVLTFFAIAGIYVLLGSEVIAVFQVLVYAGAIMVLVIFVIMFLNLRPGLFKIKPKHVFRSALAVIFTLIIFLSTLFFLAKSLQTYMKFAQKGSITPEIIETQGSFQIFSLSLFTEHLLPFELTSLLLTVAIIGVVVLIRGMTKPSDAMRNNQEMDHKKNSQEK